MASWRTSNALALGAVLLLCAQPVRAQVAVDQVASNVNAANTNTVTVSSFSCTAGALPTVGVSWFADALGNFNAASAVTYKGTNLTAAGAAIVSSSFGARLWSGATTLCDGSPGNVVATASGSIDTIVVGVVSFTGASGVADYTTNSGNGSGNSPNVTVPNTTNDDFVIDACTGIGTWTVGANQTSQWNRTFSGNRGVGSTQDGADGGAMTWTEGPDSWRCAAMRIVAAGGGGSRAPSLTTLGAGQ